MHTSTVEAAHVAAAAAGSATLTIDRGPLSLRTHYLPAVESAQALYKFASKVLGKASEADCDAALRLASMARCELNEAIERVMARNGLLHVGTKGLRA